MTPEEINDMRGLMYGTPSRPPLLSVYLRPGEARQILEIWERPSTYYTCTYGDVPEADIFRFLGLQRILAECSPSWIRYWSSQEEEAWLSVFGSLPNR